MPSSRELAFDILAEIVSHNKFADDLLRAAPSIDDIALTNELVFGILRRQSEIDFLIAHYAGRPVKLDREVRIVLQIGIYQLRMLDRIPPHAAVSTSVDLAKRARKRSAASLVNAVLRKVNRDPVDFPDEAVALNVPDWLLRRWRQNHGAEVAARIARHAMSKPKGYSRNGRQMDIGAQQIVPALDAASGHLTLDLCAAPGNKTLQLAEHTDRIVACDRTRKRLEQVPLGYKVQLDAAQPLPFGPVFDRILVDAPCSGTGTLARNPEIKWRLTEAEIAAHAERQLQILRSALDALKPGGRLVYATCSLEPEENEQVVSHFAHRVQSTTHRLPGRDEGDGFFHAVLA